MGNLKEVRSELRSENAELKNAAAAPGRLAVVVLGMHRSGTSAVAGLISKFGIGLPGDLLDAQPDNQAGFFESRQIMLAHERLFAAAGTTWHGLEDLNGIQNSAEGRQFKEEMRAFLDSEFERKPSLVLKDPRICRLAPLWLDLLREIQADVITVHVNRNPLAIAASLAHRNQFSAGRSLVIWLEHVLRAERATRGMPRMMVNFDDILEDWRPVAARFGSLAGRNLQLDYNKRIDIETFLSDQLRNHAFRSDDVLSDASLPDWVQETYAALTDAGRSGADPDTRKLDHAFDRFEKARNLFNAIARDHMRTLRDVQSESASLESSLAEAQAQAIRYAAELEALGTSLQHANERAHQLQASLSGADSIAREQALHLNASHAETSQLRDALKTAEDAFATREAAEEQLRVTLQSAARELSEQVDRANSELDTVRARADSDLADARAAERVQMTVAAELRHEKQLLDAQMAEAQARLSAEQTQNAELQRAHQREQEETLRLRRRLDELSGYSAYIERHARALETTVRDIRSSTSWKLTAPLRKLVGVTRRTRARTIRTPSSNPADSNSDGRAPAALGVVESPIAFSVPDAPSVRVRQKTREAPVDIIIPVYRGLETTRACIDSVLAHDPGCDHRIIVIDDCSPEADVGAYIASLEGHARITVLRNSENLGFVGTVNRGMSLNPGHDVVLLNSDTEVANDWLKRMVQAAYSGKNIASVTPFSNNATICSYPRYCEENALPDGLSLADTDRLFANANAGETIEIPTAVGFCMFIRRDCLDAVGLFDEDAFGKGYGEENDFCRRAMSKGWVNLLAADVFVFHKGGVSFKETARVQQEKAATVIRLRWPDYFDDVARHVARDPERPFRLKATAQRFRASGQPVILNITHAYGGGVQRNIDSLASINQDHAKFLTLRPTEGGRVRLESGFMDGVNSDFHLELESAQLLDTLRAFGVTRVHLHHSLHFPEALKEFLRALAVPFDFTIHDYHAICPRIHLGGTQGRYCAEPADQTCNACIKSGVPVYDRTISVYRSERAWMIEDADRVLAPSVDAAERIKRYFPKADIRIVPHPSNRSIAPQMTIPHLKDGERLRVLVVGMLAPHKGLTTVLDAIGHADQQKMPVEWHLLGQIQGAENPRSDRFIDHGTYDDGALMQNIKQVDPHLIWIPSLVPETFSFTLDAAIASGRPVIASDLGALSERLEGRAWSWLCPWTWTGEAQADFFSEIRRAHFVSGRPPAPPVRNRQAPDQDGFYQLEYLKPAQLAAPAIARKARPRIVAIDHSVMPTACGQIRVALPLTHPGLASHFELDILPLDDALKAKADAVLVQRTAVPDAEQAARLADHCDRRKIRKLYEIDDDLFSMPADHPEKHVYDVLLKGADVFAARADRIIVTTQPLADKMATRNARVEIIPNFLDERLWFAGRDAAPKRRVPGQPLRVVFAGSATHADDLASVSAALREANRALKGNLVFYMIGADMPSGSELSVIRQFPPARSAGHYVRFVDWLSRSSDWHVAIAPLTGSDFNRMKSPLKYLDYGALGLAGIYADQSPFADVVSDGKTGLLASSPEDWTNALIRLADDEDFRFAMAERALADIRLNHTLGANAERLRSIWSDMVT